MTHQLTFINFNKVHFMKKLLIKTIVMLFIAMIHVPTTLAAKLVATVSPQNVSQYQIFQLNLRYDEVVDASSLNFDILRDNFNLSEPRFGNQKTIINGSYRGLSEWSIVLSAPQSGSFTIPSFKIGNAQSEPITIRVSPDQYTPMQHDFIESKATLDNVELYPNQMALLRAQWIVKVDQRQLQGVDLVEPSIEASSQDGLSIEAAGEFNHYQSNVGGVNATIYERNYHITTKQPGQYTISGPSTTGSVRYNRHNTPYLLELNQPAKPLNITVLSKPENYQGFWLPTKELQLQQSWQDENGKTIATDKPFVTKVGASITRTINLTVRDLTSAQLPDLGINYPSQIRLYQEKPQYRQENGKVIMTLKQVLIPQQTGEINLPAINLNWWQSDVKQQRNTKLNGLTLTVEANRDDHILTLPAATETAALTEIAPTTTCDELSKSNSNTVADNQITIEKDSGIWPYISAFFGLLSLLTTLLWLESRRHVILSDSPPKQTDSPYYKNLVDAITAADIINAQANLTLWLEATPWLDSELKQKIEQQMQQMMAAKYSPNGLNQWDNKILLELLKQAKKQKKNRSTETLAPL